MGRGQSKREGEKERERERKSRAGLGIPRHRAPSHDPEIMSYAEIKSQTLSQLSDPAPLVL